MIYFIQMGKGGPIKIGVANDVKRRLSQLKVGSPKPLRLLGMINGSNNEEGAIHDMFAHHRLNGEWFSPHQDILNFIKNHNQYDYIAPPSGKLGEVQASFDSLTSKPKFEPEKIEKASCKKTKSPHREKCHGVNRSGISCSRYSEGDALFCYDHQFQKNGVPEGWVLEKKPKHPKIQCEGTTFSGDRCRNNALPNSAYCRLHDSTFAQREKKLCNGISKSGKRCRAYAEDKSDYCYHHQFQENGIPEGWLYDGPTCIFTDKEGNVCGEPIGRMVSEYRGELYCREHYWKIKRQEEKSEREARYEAQEHEDITITLPHDILEKPLGVLLKEISEQFPHTRGGWTD